MSLIERIGQKTPKKNKLVSQITTVLGTVSLAVSQSGLVDQKPMLKLGLEVLAVKLGAIAVYNAQKVEK
jgi:hypothetical protein